jgi:hypothetical protein
MPLESGPPGWTIRSGTLLFIMAWANAAPEGGLAA